jgi:hypothetical protein
MKDFFWKMRRLLNKIIFFLFQKIFHELYLTNYAMLNIV